MALEGSIPPKITCRLAEYLFDTQRLTDQLRIPCQEQRSSSAHVCGRLTCSIQADPLRESDRTNNTLSRGQKVRLGSTICSRTTSREIANSVSIRKLTICRADGYHSFSVAGVSDRNGQVSCSIGKTDSGSPSISRVPGGDDNYHAAIDKPVARLAHRCPTTGIVRDVVRQRETRNSRPRYATVLPLD